MKREVYLVIKRILSIVLSLILFIPALVLVAIFSILIMINDFGNPFLIQKRLGKDGKEFNLIKIRSMVKDAEKHGIIWAEKMTREF